MSGSVVIEVEIQERVNSRYLVNVPAPDAGLLPSRAWIAEYVKAAYEDMAFGDVAFDAKSQLQGVVVGSFYHYADESDAGVNLAVPGFRADLV